MKCKFCLGPETHEAIFWVRVNDEGDQMPICWCCWFEVAFDERSKSFRRRRRECENWRDPDRRFVRPIEKTKGYLSGARVKN